MHLALEGQGPPTLEMVLSRICQEFPGCLPTRVLWELENDPDQLVLQIIRIRDYERVKSMVDQAENESKLPKTPLVEQAIQMRLDLKYEIFKQRLAESKERAKQKAQHGG